MLFSMCVVIRFVELPCGFHFDLVFQQTVHNVALILVHCNNVKVFLDQPRRLVDGESRLLQCHILPPAHQDLLERRDVPLDGAGGMTSLADDLLDRLLPHKQTFLL